MVEVNLNCEADTRPDDYDIECVLDGKCDIVLHDNIEEKIREDENGETKTYYTYDTYRIVKNNYRDTLENDLSSAAGFLVWLQLAKDTEYKENATEEINKLQEELKNTDYKIIKSSEYQLAGLEIPYNIAELHAKRQQLRDRIEELRMM